MRVTDLARWSGGTLVGASGARARSFAIDSRTVEDGACFVALAGERDGHAFVPDAYERGATVAIVRQLPERVAPPPTAAAILVADPLVALGDIGRAFRRARIPSARVIAVAGSAGKTSTKDLLAGALGRGAHASPGSYNNEAGVPLTLLAAPPDAGVVVCEFGERRRGDLAYLAGIARPDVGIVTHVGLAHAELLGGPAGVLAEYEELAGSLPADGLLVLDPGDAAATGLPRRTRARTLTAGEAAGADVAIEALVLDDELRPSFRLRTPWGQAAVRLALRGRHQAGNAALAAAAALASGRPIEAVAAGLGEANAAPWRMQLARTADGITVVNDAYNASPGSVAAALRALAELPARGRRWAVLGEMRELGEWSEREHRAVGELVAHLGIDRLVAVGDAGGWIVDGTDGTGRGAAATDVVHVPDADAALALLGAQLAPGDVVLVKASRAVGLEHAALGVLERRAVGA